MCLFCLPAGASVSSDHLQEEAEEAELVAAVRQLVAERFSSNPAYQLLKGRFLSCFTVPALLATVQPIAEKTGTHQANKEEEEQEEEEVELKKIQERGKQRRAEVSHFQGKQGLMCCVLWCSSGFLFGSYFICSNDACIDVHFTNKKQPITALNTNTHLI